MVCTGCCATLDNIIAYLFKKLTRKQSKPANVESDTFLRILELHPDILQQVRMMSHTFVCILVCFLFATMCVIPGEIVTFAPLPVAAAGAAVESILSGFILGPA